MSEKLTNKKYTVKEGNTGVLYLTDQNGTTVRYQPCCDLDKTQAMLYEFYELNTCANKKVKHSFIVDSIDWYPTTVSLLYWQFFYQYVKYESLVEKWKSNKISFSSIGPGKFYNLMRSLGYHKSRRRGNISNMLRKLISRIIVARNKILVKNEANSILFIRSSLGDFRTNEILSDLKRVFTVVQLLPISKVGLKSILLDSSICIMPVAYSDYMVNVFLDKKTINEKEWIFDAALEYSKKFMSQHYAAYKIFKNYLSYIQFSAFVGIDDCNYVYPYIYAAQCNNIKCIGVQHGAYIRRHEAYVMKNIDNHQWYDYLLVWGEYWRESFLSHNKIFPPKNIFVSSNKHTYDYSCFPKNISSRSILIPYEFLADTIRIGEYIKRFISQSFKVYFKPRTDEDLKGQLLSYGLEKVCDEILILNNITPALMSNIDVVAGSMSTLLYDLLPYNKPIWILETPFKLQDDLVKSGFARNICWSDLDNIDSIYCEDMNKKINIDEKLFFGDSLVSEVVSGIVSS